MLSDWITHHLSTIIITALTVIYIASAFLGLKVITETQTPAKALGYLMLLFFLPGIGIIVYLLVGENRRINKIYDRKLITDKHRYQQIQQTVTDTSLKTFHLNQSFLQQNHDVIHLLLKDILSPLTIHNEVKVLINGEEKFPEVLAALQSAQHHIHIQYYIYENGHIGEEIKHILMDKARNGVKVRFIYDDFGSKDIRNKFLSELRSAGIEVHPFYRVRFFANRLNYRNHRKIIIVDGETAFIGGINVSDRYINNAPRNNPNQIFWRDTHLMIKGHATHALQYVFLSDWIFCSEQSIELTSALFPQTNVTKTTFTQIASSGPDSINPTIMLANTTVIHNAEKYIYITTPYFIPNESIYDAIRTAALADLDVRMLVPGWSDSWWVNKAAMAYYDELLKCGVRIYRYQKGFLHAKTIVIDDQLSVVGSANMDIRSFELNFEVNALVYDQSIALQLKNQFLADIAVSTRIDPQQWHHRSRLTRITEGIARLISAVL